MAKTSHRRDSKLLCTMLVHSQTARSSIRQETKINLSYSLLVQDKSSRDGMKVLHAWALEKSLLSLAHTSMLMVREDILVLFLQRQHLSLKLSYLKLTEDIWFVLKSFMFISYVCMWMLIDCIKEMLIYVCFHEIMKNNRKWRKEIWKKRIGRNIIKKVKRYSFK